MDTNNCESDNESVGDEVKQLLKEAQMQREKIYENIRENDFLQKRIQELESKIYKLCNHEWERDYTDYGPYSRPSFICKRCLLNK